MAPEFVNTQDSAVGSIDARENGDIHFRQKRTGTLLASSVGPLIWGFTLNRNDLITTVVNDTGLQRRDATKAVDSVFSAIIDALKGGDEVRLVGFGTFSVSERAASQGRNPRTGETIDISASKQPKFRAGKGLKDALN